MDSFDLRKGMARLQNFNQNPPREPTAAETYLNNFWVPAVGNQIFSSEYPGDVFEIHAIDKKYPEQATVTIKGKPQIIYLQDWHWAPRCEELDEVLVNFGVKVYGDCIMRNKFTLAKPTKPENYVSVIRAIRKHGYETGEDLLDIYFTKTTQNRVKSKRE
jgi:hypothetical protein